MTKNEIYRKFLDDGIIEVLNEDQIKLVLDNIKTKHKREARCLVITLYYTGARPVEVLDIKSKDIKKQGSYITVKVRGSKKGLPRIIHLRYKFPLIKELYNYAQGLFPDYVLFNHFKGKYERTIMSKSGQITRHISTTDKLRYHFKRWFSVLYEKGLNPYFLRHNRFSKLAIKGATDRELRALKGSRTNESIQPYIHMSTESSKKTAKKID